MVQKAGDNFTWTAVTQEIKGHPLTRKLVVQSQLPPVSMEVTLGKILKHCWLEWLCWQFMKVIEIEAGIQQQCLNGNEY